MRNKKFFIVLFILFLVKTLCLAQDLNVLPNGLTLITEERNHPPLTYILLTVKAGSIYENEYLGSGISHFVEHMVFKGREHEQNEEITGGFTKKIESMGGELNAYTSFDRTAYYVLLPSSKWEEGLEILFDAVLSPSFDEKEFEKEREVILREMARSEDEPSSFLSKNSWRNFFTIHPYRFPVIGEKQLFLGLEREDLINYHKKMYVSNNMILSVCGNIDKEKVKKKVKEINKTVKPSPLACMVLPKEPSQISQKTFELEKNINVGYLNIGFHIPAFAHEDTYALDLLSIILGQGKSSRLYQSLREKEQLVHSISSYSYTPLYEGIFNISATLQEENIEKTKEAIFAEIQKIKDWDIKQKELDKAKNIIRIYELQNNETLEGKTLNLTSNFIYANDLHFTEKYFKKIDNVTKEDIAQVARKYLTLDNSTIGILRTVSNTGKEEKPAPKTTESINKETLDNGLTLVLRKNSTLPLVSITAIMGGGLIIENEENNGICNILSSMLLKGTKNKTHAEIIETLESLGGSITSFPGNNSFGIRINVNSKDIDTALEILSDVLLNSNFPEDEISKEKHAQIIQISREKDSIFTYALNNLRENFFGTHPYGLNLSGKIEAISSIERKDLLELKSRFVVGENTVIAVSGDFDKTKVKNKTEKLFAPVPRGEKVSGGHVQNLEKKQIVLDEKWDQSIVMIGFSSPERKDNDFYTMEVLGSYLNGMASPLFVELRDKKALAYSTGTFAFSGWDPGIFTFYIATKKEKIEESLLGMQQEIEKLKKGEFSEREIESAKKQILTRKWKELQRNDSFAFEMALAELYNLGYEKLLNLEEKISGITKENIVEFANRYFNENQSVILLLKGN